MPISLPLIWSPATLNLLVTRNRMAALRRRLLICGAEATAFLGLEIRSLGRFLPILKGQDTSIVARDYLRAVYSYLSPKDREHGERTILPIPSTVDAKSIEQGKKVSDHLLRCLPPHHVSQQRPAFGYPNWLHPEARQKISLPLELVF